MSTDFKFPQVQVKDLIDAGVHFGHRVSRWNPKMKPYIFGKRNLIHIIDLKETVRGLLRAYKYLYTVAANNGLVLFVGTKRQAVETMVEQAQRCDMPYVTERWLGGTLTNFRTIRSRLKRLEELEEMLDGEQAATFSKKMIASLTRERRKIDRNLGGIRFMNRPPEAIFVVDPVREHNAVAEAHKLGIKVVALMDTDGDPDLIDLPIPGNDDSMRSIELVARTLADAVIEGRQAIPPELLQKAEGAVQAPGAPRGGGRRDRDRGGSQRGQRPQPQPTQAPAAPPAVPAAAESAAEAALDTPAASTTTDPDHPTSETAPVAKTAPAAPGTPTPDGENVAGQAPLPAEKLEGTDANPDQGSTTESEAKPESGS